MICYCLHSVFARENKTFQLDGMTQLYSVFRCVSNHWGIAVEKILEDKKRERKRSHYQRFIEILYLLCNG